MKVDPSSVEQMTAFAEAINDALNGDDEPELVFILITGHIATQSCNFVTNAGNPGAVDLMQSVIAKITGPDCPAPYFPAPQGSA